MATKPKNSLWPNIVLKSEIILTKDVNYFYNKYYFISDLKIPENIPKYLKKGVTVFNEMISDLSALSIQYENKINEHFLFL